MDLIQGLILQKKQDAEEFRRKQGDIKKTWFSRRDTARLAEEKALKAQAETEAKAKLQEIKQLKELEKFLSEKKRPIGSFSAEDDEEKDVPTGADSNLNLSGHKQRRTDAGAVEALKVVTEDGDEIPLERSEVIGRLRRRGEVTTYFGETDRQRYERLCQLEIAQHDDDLMEGQRNVFLQLLEGKSTEHNEQDDDFNNEDDDEFFHSVSEKNQEGEASTINQCQLDKESRVRQWIHKMLSVWEDELNARPEAEKITTAGKVVTAQYKQTKKDLKPLIKKLRQKRVDSNVLEKIHDMVELCDKKEYKLAHDKYIELSIGNAAWPMGVTMVGIHERAGRSKIFTSEIAHILNDETTRKYIHMFKRLISFAQRKFPTDPSRMVCLSTIHV